MKPQTVEFDASIGDEVVVEHYSRPGIITGLTQYNTGEQFFFVVMEENFVGNDWFPLDQLSTVSTNTEISV